MNLVLSPLVLIPILILGGEALLAAYLAERRAPRRRLIVIGSYLALVLLALILPFTGNDEFGYAVIPLLTVTAPWYFILGLTFHIPAVVALGTVLNCAIFWIIGELSYSRHDVKLSY